MKECKYCGTKYKDELDACPNCGGNLIVTAEEIAKAAELAQKEKENQERSVAEPQNHLKKLIGIIVGVVVAVIIIVVGAFYAHNHRAVNGDLSRADMAEAYEQGVAFYNSGDYASAIAELGKVSSHSKYYDEATPMLGDSVNIYCNDVISKASAYANTSDYKMACSILENALQVVPANSALTAELASYQETFKNQLRSSTLEAVEGSIAENDYPTAIQTLTSALEELGSDIELNALLEKYKGGYCDMIIAQADAALEGEGYEAAITIINQGLLILPDNENFLSRIVEYEGYKPVNLSDCYVISAEKWSRPDVVSYDIVDNLGNSYPEAYRFDSWSGSYIEYNISGEYSRLKGKLAPGTFTKQYGDLSKKIIAFSIFGDDKLLAAFEISYKTFPVDFDIDVSDVSVLRLSVPDTSGYGEGPTCIVYLIDGHLEK